MGTSTFSPSAISSIGVAEHSGGQFTSLRTAEQQLARIDEASRNGYILGYVPRDPLLDGKYRNVRVEVNRKNVTLVYRRGYTARPDLPSIDPTELLIRARLRDAATSDIAISDIKVEVDARSISSPERARQVQVELKIDATKLSLSRVGDKWQSKLDLMILCGDSQQNVVGRLEQQMTLNMTDAVYEQARTSGIPYAVTVLIKAPASRVKIIVYDFANDLLGIATVAVR
jgi:hypothetical protein